MRLPIRVVSWNLHGTPVAPRLYPRLRASSAEILRRAPDLVLLQEIWHPRHAAFVTRLLAPVYRRLDAGGVVPERPPGGLVALVRDEGFWQVRGVAFETYRSTAPAWKIWEGDGLAGKGVQSLELQREGVRLVALHTHLQAAYRPAGYTEVRRDQLAQLAACAARIDPALPVFVAGDLNTRPGEQRVWEGLGAELVDLTAAFRERCGCGTLPEAPDWIDYLLARTTGGWQARASLELIRSTGDDHPYSDHHGLAATLDFERSETVSRIPATLLATLEGPSSRRRWLAAAVGLARAWVGL